MEQLKESGKLTDIRAALVHPIVTAAGVGGGATWDTSIMSCTDVVGKSRLTPACPGVGSLTHTSRGGHFWMRERGAGGGSGMKFTPLLCLKVKLFLTTLCI